MRCGLARSRVCLFLRFGVVRHLSSDFSRTSSRLSRISVFSWVIRGKPWVTTSTTEKRAKCLSLGMVSSLRKSFSVGEQWEHGATRRNSRESIRSESAKTLEVEPDRGT